MWIGVDGLPARPRLLARLHLDIANATIDDVQAGEVNPPQSQNTYFFGPVMFT